MKRFINPGAAVLITVLVFNYASRSSLACRLVAPPSTLRAAGIVKGSPPVLREPSRTGADEASHPLAAVALCRMWRTKRDSS